MAKYLLAGSDINWLAIMALLTFVFVFTLVLIMVLGRGRGSYAEVEQQPLIDSYSSNDKTDIQ
ncbi:hypothetical protein FUA23_04335 [Neolewinella aurantiaca]|uniref:CcoQ/FixQ family Cbb3-type cytochrome c oxidase assembly chaperone n=1 Tax=Neolewinella aurantiaca TaxID=2602767 RepID=A0A5C7FZ68_9BACT|nr:hypothetical protein [Neolewinella aurantiaca]TXF91037.1 hypothetical protein FUA23_04335 [Neolewinella aurantiaca]